MQGALPAALGGVCGTHLSTHEFHEAILRCQKQEEPGNKKQVLIDTRNHYETAVGRFKGAIDPKLRTFAQFPGWVLANKEKLEGADVYMYCTGGIRCEKASSYLASLGIASSVSQLSGGIHSYLAEYSSEAREAGLKTVGLVPGLQDRSAASTSATKEERAMKKLRAAEDEEGSEPAECLWQGVNYSFDARYSSSLAGGSGHVGRCCYCGSKWSTISAEVVCSVCCDQILVCKSCRQECQEWASVVGVGSMKELLPGALDAASLEVPLRLPPPPPPPDIVKAKGVNFSKRIEAEQKSTYLCTEHNLLSDCWREFLSRAETRGLSLSALESALQQLRKQLAVSKGRGGKPRRRNLQAQIERMALWLEERGVCTQRSDEPVNKAPSGDPNEEWAAYFPLLNLWGC
jgi:rhodanese-related sulfurtransferase